MSYTAVDLRPGPQVEREAMEMLERAHQRAMRASDQEIATHLQKLLGQRLTAYIAGSRDPKAVGKWARGERRPSPTAARKLREAYHVAALLTLAEDEETTQTWFVGMNPFLRDRSPAYAIRDLPNGGEQAMDAALAFISYD